MPEDERTYWDVHWMGSATSGASGTPVFRLISAGFRQVDSTPTWDINFTYRFFEGNESWIGNTSVQLGIQNVFDLDPPESRELGY